jgi:hypothetical protein
MQTHYSSGPKTYACPLLSLVTLGIQHGAQAGMENQPPKTLKCLKLQKYYGKICPPLSKYGIIYCISCLDTVLVSYLNLCADTFWTYDSFAKILFS